MNNQLKVQKTYIKITYIIQTVQMDKINTWDCKETKELRVTQILHSVRRLGTAPASRMPP